MIFSFINHKGGTAKTTSTINVGAVLAQKGYKVLLIDLDGQASLTTGLGIEKPPYSLLDVFKKTISAPIILNHSNNLDVLPANRSLIAFENAISDEPYREKILKNMLSPYIDKYDFILFDCPPTLNVIVFNALEITDFVFVPMEAEIFSYEGLENIISAIVSVNKNSNSALDLGGIFITRINERRKLTKDVTEFVKRKFDTDLMNTSIRISVKVGESQMEGMPTVYYDVENNASIDYNNLTNEILERIKK